MLAISHPSFKLLIIKSRRMGLAWRVARISKMRNA